MSWPGAVVTQAWRGPLSNFRSVGRWPRLGRYHGRLLATPDRKHGAVMEEIRRGRPSPWPVRMVPDLPG